MSNSTLDLLSGLLTPDLLRTAAKATGESDSGIAKALGASFPAILGQLAQGSGNASMMGSVIDLVKSPVVGSMLGSGGGVLGQVGSILTHGDRADGIGPIASKILEMLFGKNVAAVAGAIGSLAGLRNSGTAMSLLKLAGPMVLAALGNRLGGSLTGAALGALLGKEKDGIMAAVPGPLSGAMGLLGGAPALAQAAGSVATAAGMVGAAAAAKPVAAAVQATPKAPAPAAHYDDEPSGGSAIGGSIIGLLITGAVLAGLVFGITQCNRKPEPPPAAKAAAPAPAPAPAPAKVAEAPKTAAPAPAPVTAPPPAPAAAVAPKAASLLDSLKPGEGGLMSLALPNGKTIALAAKGVEGQLIAFLEDASKPIDKGTWFDFDRLSFKTASSDLTAESRSQVEAVAEIMKVFPTSEIKIGGYTDNQGDPAMNLKLSDDRANSVMRELVGLGVDASRLTAEGYGEQHAIADNATAEGRAKNRRTALSVRKR